jgi:multiple sugar transport system permease protein
MIPRMSRRSAIFRHPARGTLIFLSPWLVSFALFGLYPLLFSLLVSLTDYNPLRGSMDWLGLANYLKAMRDPLFWQSLKVTLIFVAGTIPFTTSLALGLALLLNRPLRGRGVLRASFFLPTVVSSVVVSLIFKQVYSPFGLLNAFLHVFGLSGRSWLQDPGTALPAVMAMDVWAAIGYYMVIYLAGLQTIPAELYEAAALDGAIGWRAHLHVTLPLLLPTTLFVVVINTIRSLQVFIEVFVMTRGGPLNATLTTVYYLYDQGFRYFSMGYASAIAYLLFVVILGFALVQSRLLRSRVEA